MDLTTPLDTNRESESTLATTTFDGGTFDGSALLLQDDLLHQKVEHLDDLLPEPRTCLDRLAASIRRAFELTDDDGALLVIEIDDADPLETEAQLALLDHVATIARQSIRKSDVLEQLDYRTLAIGLPDSGRIGMTRVADAIRQRVAAAKLDDSEDGRRTTITIGAVHTTEARMVDLDELLLAARVNLDAARAAGKNRTNWSDWGSLQ